MTSQSAENLTDVGEDDTIFMSCHKAFCFLLMK